MSGWSYETRTATAGKNKQEVRELTAGECRVFTTERKAAKAETAEAGADDKVITAVVKMGCINPERSEMDVDAMPADLRRECFRVIMDMTGKGLAEKKDETATASS